MQKFSFDKKEKLLTPQTDLFRYACDKDGKQLSGDDLIKTMGKIINTFEKKNERPIPIADQKFVAWVKQFCNALDKGISSEEIFKRSTVTVGL